MRTTLKNHLLLFLLSATALLFSCSTLYAQENKIVGKWKTIDVFMDTTGMDASVIGNVPLIVNELLSIKFDFKANHRCVTTMGTFKKEVKKGVWHYTPSTGMYVVYSTKKKEGEHLDIKMTERDGEVFFEIPETKGKLQVERVE